MLAARYYLLEYNIESVKLFDFIIDNTFFRNNYETILRICAAYITDSPDYSATTVKCWITIVAYHTYHSKPTLGGKFFQFFQVLQLDNLYK